MKINKLLLIVLFLFFVLVIFLLTASPVSEAASATASVINTAVGTPVSTPAKTIIQTTPAATVSLSPAKKSNSVQVRDDGLTIINYDTPKESDQTIAFLTMVLKTGYAHDPKGKAGLTGLTNDLMDYLLQNTAALSSSYYISSDFSYYNFSITSKDFNNFCKELDEIIRLDALLLYDKCNELIQFYENEPQLPSETGNFQLYELLFGKSHPYLVSLQPNYQKLNINEVNNWFRKIYRPNNMIIASSAKLPSDFLLKPSGREMAETVLLDKIPSADCSAIPAVSFTAVRDNLNSVFIGLPMPRINEDGFFTAAIVQEYLKKALWNKLREESGFCYDLQVSYSYFYQSSAPILTITFQTFPADSPEAIGQVFQILRVLANEGIREDELSLIKGRKKNLSEYQGASLRQKNLDYAFQVLFNLEWLSNQDEYLKQLNQVTSAKIAKLVSERLKYLKVSITGPSDMDEFLKDINQKVSSLADLVK